MPMPPRQLFGLYRGLRYWKASYCSVDGTPLPCLHSRYRNYGPWRTGWNITEQPGLLRISHHGFYAFTSVDKMRKYYRYDKCDVSLDYVVGSVLAAGRIVRAHDGFRAERARVEHLALTGDLNLDMQILRLCEQYKVTPISTDELFALPTGFIEGATNSLWVI